MMATHLSRLAEDLIIYGSSEFGFVQFGDAFTHRLEHDAAEAQSRCARARARLWCSCIGDLTTLLATLKGLPSGYNKDLQDDKRVLFDAVTPFFSCFRLSPARSTRSLQRKAHARGAVEQHDGDGSRGLSRGEGATFREAHAAIGH